MVASRFRVLNPVKRGEEILLLCLGNRMGGVVLWVRLCFRADQMLRRKGLVM
jgi:hypothetical protein